MLLALLSLVASAADPRLDVRDVALPRVDAAQATPVRGFLAPFSFDWSDDAVQRCASGEDVSHRLPLAIASLVVRPGASMTVWGVEAGSVDPSGHIAEGERRGRLILPLYDRLLDISQAAESLAAEGCTPWSDERTAFQARFLVIADGRLPASTLEQIQFTLGEAGFEQSHLLVDAARTVGAPDAGDPDDFTFVDARPEASLSELATAIARVRHGSSPAPTIRLRIIEPGEPPPSRPPREASTTHVWTVSDAIPTLAVHLGRRSAPSPEEAEVVLDEEDELHLIGDRDMGPGPRVSLGDPIILGALDRALIDRVIRRHLVVFRSCYQRELQLDPLLQGKLVVKFVIAKNGSVSKASVKTSTLGNERLESCVVERLLRVQFPTPKGGGIVIVSYPLMFRPN